MEVKFTNRHMNHITVSSSVAFTALTVPCNLHHNLVSEHHTQKEAQTTTWSLPAAPTPAPGNHQSASCPAGLSVLGRGHSREGIGVSEGPDCPASAVPTESPSQISASLGCLCCFFSLSLSSLQDKIKGRSLKQNTFFFPDRFHTEGLSNEPPSGTSL